MRQLGQAKVVAQLAEVDEQLDKAAVIGLEESLQSQQGEKRMRSEVLAGELGGMGRERFAR
jgi:hypothetical protein